VLNRPSFVLLSTLRGAGRIPTELGLIGGLEELYLCANSLTGACAGGDRQHSSMTVTLCCRSAQTASIVGVTMTRCRACVRALGAGEVPSELAQLAALKTLYVQVNKLTGESVSCEHTSTACCRGSSEQHTHIHTCDVMRCIFAGTADFERSMKSERPDCFVVADPDLTNFDEGFVP